MKLWKNPQPTYTEWQTTGDATQLAAPWVEASEQELAAWQANNVPVPYVPPEVGGGQITAAMIELDYAATPGELDTLIVGIIEAAVPAGKERQKAIALWRRAGTFKRDHPMIEAVRLVLGKTHEQIDQLFQLADTL